jgi:hypothetical protein
MRRFARSTVFAWLACQLIGVASPLALASDRFGIDQAVCCDGVAPGAVCPMHHRDAGDRTCKMESACGHHDSALLALVAVAIPETSATTISSQPNSARVTAFADSTLARIARIDLPPPRI